MGHDGHCTETRTDAPGDGRTEIDESWVPYALDSGSQQSIGSGYQPKSSASMAVMRGTAEQENAAQET